MFQTQVAGSKDSLHGKAGSAYDESYANQVFKFHSSEKAEEESDSGEDWDYGSEEETTPQQTTGNSTNQDKNIDLMAFIDKMDVAQI